MELFGACAHPIGTRPKRNRESTYLYYRDSERVGVIAIRELLEEWFAEIPEVDQLDLRNRFRSPIDVQHGAALFELYLHHFLKATGHTIEFHPVIEGRPTRPDFLATSENGTQFYLEAVSIGDSPITDAEESRINQVFDTLNDLQSPDFFLEVSVDGAPASPPPGAQLRKEIDRWLKSLSWAEISALYASERFDLVPVRRWHYAGWDVEFTPIPKSANSRGTASARAIGITGPAKARFLSQHEYVRDAVKSKNRYGQLPLPFAIAIQVVGDFPIHREDVMSGLMGQDSFIVSRNGSTRESRVPNGAWTSHDGPKNTTVSAVAVWSTLVPWNFASNNPMLVHNPFARNHMPADLLPIAQWKLNEETDTFDATRGLSIASVLRLPEPWPPSLE